MKDPRDADTAREGGDASGVVATLLESGLAVTARAPGAPTLPGRYEDLGPIAGGSFGEVRRVRDTLLDRVIAMKLLRAEHAAASHLRRRFLAEARITARLQHPGIIAIHDRGELADGRLWFTMKEVRGRTLGDVIDELHAASGPEGFGATASGWTFRRLVDAFARIAQAVAYAHSRGVVHRDLKPDNMMVGEFGEVLVMDWGLARLVREPSPGDGDKGSPDDSLSPEMTHHGDVLGTPAYMPPEQARGDTALHGPESDVYALGAVLHHLLSGAPPYHGKTVSIIASILSGERPAAPRITRRGGPIPAELTEIAARAMCPDPGGRHPSAEGLIEEVVAWLDGVRRREQALAALDRARSGEPEIAAAIAEAESARARARVILGGLRPFDPIEQKRPAWDLEDEASRLARAAALAETGWLEAVHGALSLDPALPEAHAALADHYRARLVEAERGRRGDDAARFEVLLRAHDRGRHAAFLRGDGAVSLVTDPEGASVIAERFEARDRRLFPVFHADLGQTPLREVALPHGSYLLRLRAPGRAEVRYPVLIERGEHWDGCAPGEREPSPIALPREGELGPEECYVPAGFCWTGGDPEAPDCLPARRLWVDGFVIGRYPVTLREYLIFLNDLRASGRESEAIAACPRREPGAAEAGERRLVLERDATGRFLLPGDGEDRVWQPEFPAVQIDWHAASAYVRWLADRTRAPFRLLNEVEREKAARGADARSFPWGNHADATFACVLEGHRGEPAREAVSGHPTDESAHGVRGLAGNVRDWCINVWRQDGPPVEAGRLAHDAEAPDDAEFRSVHGGFWGAPIANSRSAGRFGSRPGLCRYSVGLRTARSYPVRDR